MVDNDTHSTYKVGDTRSPLDCTYTPLVPYSGLNSRLLGDILSHKFLNPISQNEGAMVEIGPGGAIRYKMK